MEWDNKFSVGVKEIDDQHKNLFQRLKHLQASLDTGMNPREIGVTIKALVEYTQTHFADEERFMETIRFPELTNHMNLHKKLISEIRVLLLKIKKGDAVNTFDMIDFLKKWLSDHIIIEDMKIAKFFLTKKNDAKENS